MTQGYDVIDEPGTQLAPVQAGGGALIHQSAQQIEQMAVAIEAKAAARKRLLKAVAGFTFEHDWQDFGGKLYLEGEGAMRLVGPLGLHITKPDFDVSQIGDDYFVECGIEASWPAMGSCPIYEIGACSTRDKFFADLTPGRDGQPKQTQLTKTIEQCGGDDRLARRAMLGHIKKKAYQNALSRAVSELLGLKGLKPEDLGDLGFKYTKIAYKQGATKQSAAAAKKASQSVTPDQLAGLAAGSVVDVVGTLESVGTPQKSAKGADFCYLNFPNRIGIAYWASSCPDWADGGASIVCKNVEAKIVGDKRYYNCREIELAEAGGNEG